MYAKKLTKDYLLYLGITSVTADGIVYKKGKELKPLYDGRYYLIQLYDPAIRQSIPKEKRTNASGQFIMPLARIVYIWYHDYIDDGLVIDHIDDNKLNNNINNLQAVTPSDNLCKGTNKNTKLIKCDLSQPRSYYEERLSKYEQIYMDAKANKNVKEAHKQRSNIANTRARLRYWDAYQGKEIKDEIDEWLDNLHNILPNFDANKQIESITLKNLETGEIKVLPAKNKNH